MAPALQPGAVFDGRYRLEEPIDDFGVGESWRARDAGGATVIVKLLPPLGASDHAAAGRFHDLGRALAATRHRGILATLRHGICQARPYLVHEFFAGVSLARGFALARTGRHLLAPGALANLLDRACEAVDAAHRASPPLVHGGLMPASLVAAMIAGRFDLRVIDFGLAQVFGERLTIERATEYMAPSLEDDPGHATAADDVFALGTVVMEAVTDRRDAQQGVGTLGNLSAVAKRRKDIPAALMAVATRATRVDARQRFADVASLRDALAAAWSPDARPTPDESPALPSGIAGVAAEYTSWVRFAEADGAAPITPVATPVATPAAPPVVAPPLVTPPAPEAAFVSPPADLAATQRVAEPASNELLGATTKLPPKGAAGGFGQTFVAVPHAPAPSPAMPPTQMLQQFEAPSAQPVSAPPQRVYGAAPQVDAYAPVATQPASRHRGAWIAAVVVALLAVVAVAVAMGR